MSDTVDLQVGDATLSFVEGDITRISADAVVSAANSRLIGGGGVDGAIHRAGGPSIMRELDAMRPTIGRCETGQAVVTGAGNLPARWVIHAVGPVYRGGKHGEPDLLASCYRVSMQLAAERGARTIAFPSISTGVYGYPVVEAAAIAVGIVAEELRRPGCVIEQVTFVLFGVKAFRIHTKAAERLLG